MFPEAFHARVAQRMAIWGAMLGFLVLLYAATEVIQAWQATDIAGERQRTTAEAMVHVTAGSPGGIEAGRKLIGAIEAVDERDNYLAGYHRQNQVLLLLLTLFIVAEILFLEYRWLIRPLVRMAQVLRTGKASPRDLHHYAARRDEIGVFAQALTGHFSLVAQQQETARAEQAKLSDRLSRQERFRHESLSFQGRIADIIQRLEDHAGRMSSASDVLAARSADAQRRAGMSAESTERVSGHVDLVASSMDGIARTLTSAAEDAERTSAVAVTARSIVEAARSDAVALSEAARTIEQVVALIEDVAGQTNLLALNATIEAARAGEMGRGFGVVAQEVKQLAARTSQATDDVRARLQGITAASSRIGERVAALVDSIEQVTGVASAIAQSMRMQDATSQAITANTSRTAADVREVATTVKDVAAMIGEAKTAADLVTKVSTDLSQQAADLRAVVERFIETTERVAA
jgi:methyl-accepting chemotaxis protein